MTVAVDTTRLEYLGNGSTTAFFFPWRLLENQDITAWVNHIQRFDILVTGGQTDAGGTVTFSTAPPAGQYVWLIRAIPQTQPYDLHEFDTLSAESQEVAYDRLTLLLQDLQSQVDRCIQFEHTAHITGISNVMPLPGAGQHIAWNFAGNRLVTVPPDTGGGGGGGGDVSGEGVDSEVAFWTGEHTLSGDGKFLWDNGAKALTVGTVPFGGQKPGNAFMGLIAPTNATGMNNLLLQTVQGDPSGVGLVTLGDDRVSLSAWTFRGTGATNPIYGANLGVVFSTNGVANGLEIDVQNDSGTNIQGQALWLNGSTRSSTSAGHRANAILIDTQDASKWDRGILFKEGFVANGSTGSILTMGIHFERNQDSDFIVIQPRQGAAANVAIKITNPAFTLNRLEILNSGTLRVSNSMTGPAFPAYSFLDGAGPTAGMYLEAIGTAGLPSSGAVLGWAVNSLRRMTLGDGLTVWNSGPGANQGGSIVLSDPSAVHSVGFLAPDFVTGLGSFRIRLPAEPGTSGQCLITSGGFPIETWSYAACGTGGGGGGGGTVTNTGVLGLNQVIIGDGGVALKGLGTLGTGTTVLHGNAAGLPSFAPVVVVDIGATGTPSSTTFLRGDGTWSTPSGSGTVTTSGAPLAGQVPFYTSATAISGDPHFKWSNAGQQLSIGLGNDVTSPSQALVVLGKTTGSGDGTMQVWGAYAGASPTLNPPVPLTLIGDFLGGAMPTGFGVTLDLAVHDGVGNAFVAGFLNATAQTMSPPTTAVVIGTQVAGVPTAMVTIDNSAATFVRQITAYETATVDPQGGTVALVKNFGGAALAPNDGLGRVVFGGANMTPTVGTIGAAIHSNVDGTGGSAIKGRLTFHTSDGTTLTERMRITSTGVTTLTERLIVGGPGQTSANYNPISANLGGAVWMLDTGGSFGNGGVAVFGAAQGAFAAIKGLLTNGGPNPLGDLTFSTRAQIGDTLLTERMRMTAAGEIFMGSPVVGAQATGPLKVGITTPDNGTPYQSILGQLVNGTYTPGAITLANDKVAVAGGAYRGAGGTSPIYAGVFQIGFTTTGVANAVEVGVLNTTGVNGIGNGVWVNGNGNHRANAILIDTQDVSKWGAGVRFVEGNTGLGATGSILNYGIIFDKSQDQDFIVIRPRVGVTTNRAIRITDVAFSTNKFELWNDGTINTQGFIQTTGNIGAVQYFSSGIGGISTTKTAGTCVFTITGGLVTNITGC